MMTMTVPKADWVGSVSADRKNRITLGLNCMLLKTAGKTVLVDTGAGSSGNEGLGLAPSRLSKNLRSIGVAEKSIDIVILSNLHFDHCGGSIRLDRRGTSSPRFRMPLISFNRRVGRQPAIPWSTALPQLMLGTSGRW
jgi:glyoxylase-like metal-dependent hydrolase (beta-lactamase superfamily II)